MELIEISMEECFSICIFSIKMLVSKASEGLDFLAPTGTPIYPIANGRVTKKSFMKNGYGYYLTIDHGNGYTSLYGHNNSTEPRNITVGTYVDTNTIIAYVGSTGFSDSPHLHLNIDYKGKHTNPYPYIFEDLIIPNLNPTKLNIDYSLLSSNNIITLEQNKDYKKVLIQNGNLTKEQEILFNCYNPNLPNEKVVETSDINNNGGDGGEIDGGEYNDEEFIDNSYEFLAFAQTSKDEIINLSNKQVSTTRDCIRDIQNKFVGYYTKVDIFTFIDNFIKTKDSTARIFGNMIVYSYKEGTKNLLNNILSNCGMSLDTIYDFVDSDYLPNWSRNLLKWIIETVNSLISNIDKTINLLRPILDPIINIFQSLYGYVTSINFVADLANIGISIGGSLLCSTIALSGIGLVLAPLCAIGVSLVAAALHELILFSHCLTEGHNDCEFRFNKVAENFVNDIIISVITFGIGKAISRVVQRIKIGNNFKFFIKNVDEGGKLVDNVNEILDWKQIAKKLDNVSNTKGNFGIGKYTKNQTDDLGKAWVGDGAKLSSDGKSLISADGLKKYRFPAYKVKVNKTQANLEWRSSVNDNWFGGNNGAGGNAHIEVIE